MECSLFQNVGGKILVPMFWSDTNTITGKEKFDLLSSLGKIMLFEAILIFIARVESCQAAASAFNNAVA